MCGIFGACCGNANKACHCLSLRTFAFIWLAVSILVALTQFVAGAYLSYYLAPVDSLLSRIKESIMSLEDPTFALNYYKIVEDSLSTVWRGMSLLTTVRGVYDIVAIIVWVIGWYKRKMGLIYFFIGMTALDFFLDFCLLIVFLIVINALYIAYFYPTALLIPFALYGWQTVLGPCILHLLMSHAYVMAEGGNGTEMKNWEEIREMKSKAASNDVEDQKAEKSPLLGGKDNEGTSDEEKGKPKVFDKGSDEDSVIAEPVIEVTP